MYILNIDILPVSKTFKNKLHPLYTVLEQSELIEIPSENVIGLYCRFAKVIDEQILKKYNNLQFVACNATGIEHIDKNACKNNGISIYSLEGSAKFLSKNITSSAEHTWCLALAAARNLKFHQSALSNKIFDRNCNLGMQLKNKKLGLIGIGRNGLQIAKYASAFDMTIQYYDPYKIVPKYKKIYSLENLFSLSNMVIISCKLTDETRFLIDETILKKGNSLILVNTSRGEIVYEDHILKSIDQGYVSTYATDVIVDEGNALKSEMYLRSLIDNRILITPHIGGATLDAWNITESHLADMIISAGHKF